MDFSFTEEQRMLRDMVGSFLADRYDFDARRVIEASPTGMSREVWSAFAEELGILGAAVPEDAGGLGGGPVENMLVMEALGEHLVIEPYFETAVVGAGFLKRSDAQAAREVLAAVATGEAVTALAWAEPQGRFDPFDLATSARRDGDGWVLDGRKAVVDAAPWATHLIVTARTGGDRRDRDGAAVFLVEAGASGVTARDYGTVDGRRASELQFDGARAVRLDAEGTGADLIDLVFDEAAAAACAEAVGVMRRLHRDTLDYAKQRRQFGRAIGDFQVLQHRLVDMFMEVEQAVSMTYMATLKLDATAAERGRAVSAAKAKVAQGLRFVGQNAIQTHGGIGVTDELAVAHYFKRATVLESLFGDADRHLARFERLGRRAA